MKVIRTEQVFIRGNGTVSKMCHISKNLFNQTNYILRNQFFNHNRMSSYKTLAKQFAEPSALEENNNSPFLCLYLGGLGTPLNSSGFRGNI